jgi:hypothetical protein
VPAIDPQAPVSLESENEQPVEDEQQAPENEQEAGTIMTPAASMVALAGMAGWKQSTAAKSRGRIDIDAMADLDKTARKRRFKRWDGQKIN